MLKLYNTLTKKVEGFAPRDPKIVTLYCCGPTVYDYAHIGNFRTYTMTDFLVRTLKYLGYSVKYVMNVTDVGHLTSDADEGQDKMEKSAKREGKTAWDIAKFYTDAFLTDSKKLNLLEPDVRPKPTVHIKEQIAMVETLLSKGFAYTIDDGIYFDTSKFAGYGKLTGQSLSQLKGGARVEPNPQKKNPTDFALWKFSYPKGRSFDPTQDASRRHMEWNSPWGKGFPGWHIECSAMSMKYLGETFDIHTGGMDLIPIHHTNEIAQSEGATGKSPFVRFWVHGQFIMVDNAKMAKSKSNFYRLADIEAKGFEPLALRYMYMSAHYRAFLNFTWEALASAQESLKQLRKHVSVSAHTPFVHGKTLTQEAKKFNKKFQESLEDDLNIPKAISVAWEVAKSKISPEQKSKLLMAFDTVLGLALDKSKPHEDVSVPEDLQVLINTRDKLRNEGNFQLADEIRKQIEKRGYVLEDAPDGIRVKRRV